MQQQAISPVADRHAGKERRAAQWELVEVLGQQIRAIREDQRPSQTLVAKRAGLTPFGLRTIERGDSDPRWTTLLALAEVLDVAPADLVAPPPGRSTSSRRPRASRCAGRRAGGRSPERR